MTINIIDRGSSCKIFTTEPNIVVNQEIITEEYVKHNKEFLFSLLSDRGIDLETLPKELYANAINLGEGISGAQKLTVKGKIYVLKTQKLTEDFKRNLLAILSRSSIIAHAYVSESDDSFADFPRKEVLGVRIAAAFGIEVPQTQLVATGEHEIGSLQEFITQERAVAMSKKPDISPVEIEFHSAMNTIFFHLITEDIDGHSGNILLVKKQSSESDEDDISDFKAVPIDFGLIFPRHRSIYPQEMNLVKKDFYKLFERKTISTQKDLKPFLAHAENINTPEIQSIAKEHEFRLLKINLAALQKIAEKAGKMKLPELFDAFVKNATLLQQTLGA